MKFGEHSRFLVLLNGIQEVSGSIPLGSTKFPDNIKNLVIAAPAGL